MSATIWARPDAVSADVHRRSVHGGCTASAYAVKNWRMQGRTAGKRTLWRRPRRMHASTTHGCVRLPQTIVWTSNGADAGLSVADAHPPVPGGGRTSPRLPWTRGVASAKDGPSIRLVARLCRGSYLARAGAGVLEKSPSKCVGDGRSRICQGWRRKGKRSWTAKEGISPWFFASYHIF